MQMIFQDPYSSLDPRMTVLDIVAEPLVSNSLAKGQELEDRVKDLMRVVGLEVKHLKRYPHAFSGGQRQRIGIARALAPRPEFIVCDRGGWSALDVSIQAQILNLLQDLQAEFNLTYLFIAHDLSVIEHISDRVGVMYVGKMVELASTEQLFGNPKHPYTEALLSAVPQPDPETKMDRIILPGEVANPANPPLRLLLPSALRLRQGRVQDRRAGMAGSGTGPLRGLPLRQGAQPQGGGVGRPRPSQPQSTPTWAAAAANRCQMSTASGMPSRRRCARVRISASPGYSTSSEPAAGSLVRRVSRSASLPMQQSLQRLEQVAAQQQHGHALVDASAATPSPATAWASAPLNSRPSISTASMMA